MSQRRRTATRKAGRRSGDRKQTGCAASCADCRGHAGLQRGWRARIPYAGAQAGTRCACAAAFARDGRRAARGSLADGGARRPPRTDDVHRRGRAPRGRALWCRQSLSDGQRHDGGHPCHARRHARARGHRACAAKCAPLRHRRHRARRGQARLDGARGQRTFRHPDGRCARNRAACRARAPRGKGRAARLSDILWRRDRPRGHRPHPP